MDTDSVNDIHQFQICFGKLKIIFKLLCWFSDKYIYESNLTKNVSQDGNKCRFCQKYKEDV